MYLVLANICCHFFYYEMSQFICLRMPIWWFLFCSRPIESPPAWADGQISLKDNDAQTHLRPPAVTSFGASHNSETSVTVKVARFQESKRTKSPPSLSIDDTVPTHSSQSILQRHVHAILLQLLVWDSVIFFLILDMDWCNLVTSSLGFSLFHSFFYKKLFMMTSIICICCCNNCFYLIKGVC